MKDIKIKKRLYMAITAILLVLLIFGTAALCNKCLALSSDKDTGDGTEETIQQVTESTLSEKEKLIAEEEKAKAIEAEKMQSQTNQETSGSDTENNTSSTSAATESGSDDSSASSSGMLPSINLSIYEGPVYSAEDGVYYYRVKADVTGTTPVTISFSRDDSHGAWGLQRTQINLLSGQSYNLTAVSSNSAGTASDSITLTAPGSSSGSSSSSGTNRSPEAGDITISSTTLITNANYNISVSASDADGDSLSYAWSTTGGIITNTAANPSQYRTPGTAGSYTISVTISDGRGGIVTRTKTVAVSVPTAGVGSTPDIISVQTLNLPIVFSEGGYIESDGFVNGGSHLFAGDSNNNQMCCGFISFDITGIAGATIQSATLTCNLSYTYGNPSSSFSDISVFSTYYGARALTRGDFSITAYNVGYSSIPSFSMDGMLVTRLQEAIREGRNRFQLIIGTIPGSSDRNNNWDGWEYQQSNITLTISYIPSL